MSKYIGIDTFDNYIDHSYDTIDSWTIRCDRVLIELARVFKDLEKNLLCYHNAKSKKSRSTTAVRKHRSMDQIYCGSNK